MDLNRSKPYFYINIVTPHATVFAITGDLRTPVPHTLFPDATLPPPTANIKRMVCALVVWRTSGEAHVSHAHAV